jgi:hypothetical protein
MDCFETHEYFIFIEYFVTRRIHGIEWSSVSLSSLMCYDVEVLLMFHYNCTDRKH